MFHEREKEDKFNKEVLTKILERYVEDSSKLELISEEVYNWFLAFRYPWVLISQRKPPSSEYVLFKYDNGFMFMECWGNIPNKENFEKGMDETGPITHWMFPPY